jgi:hypothetical protein
MYATNKLAQRGWGLASRRLFWVLLGLNVLASLAVAASAFSVASGDHYTYMGYADGLLHGRYSYWYFYPDYIPDTFRNPGYPLLLALLKGLGLGEAGIRVVQLGLYAAAIGLVLQLARCGEVAGSWTVRNLFLLLLLPNVQLAYFSALIFPEGPVAFLLVAYAVVVLTWRQGSWGRTVGLALLAGLIFQCRPVFILFPLGQVMLDYWLVRPRRIFAWGQAIVFLLLYGATMLPYAAWNYQHHGVFKPTSLEGGAGVMQIGFWALRMPGYLENRYWGNRMGEEVVRFANPAQVPSYIAAFNHEWDVIDAQCRPLLNARDRHYLPLMRRDHGLLFPTHSTAYTLRREQLLMQINLANIRREPGYYFKTRLYTLVRLWVTGVQVSAWQAATTPVAKIKVLYPALVSGLTFIVALLSISWALWHQRWLRAPTLWWLALALVVYFGVIHLPFAIQARYTVPVRPWLLLATALALAAWLERRASIAS